MLLEAGTDIDDNSIVPVDINQMKIALRCICNGSDGGKRYPGSIRRDCCLGDPLILQSRNDSYSVVTLDIDDTNLTGFDDRNKSGSRGGSIEPVVKRNSLTGVSLFVDRNYSDGTSIFPINDEEALLLRLTGIFRRKKFIATPGKK